MKGSLGFLILTFLIIHLPNFFIFCIGHSYSHSHSQLHCINTERHALLTFKQDLIDPSNRLSSWTVDGDCCGFAIEERYEAYLRSMFDGKLNPFLLDLKHLNYFDLSFNNFSASPIPSFLDSMKSLTSLNLSNARFMGLIPHQFGNLSNLLCLNLECYRTNDLYVNNLQWPLGIPLLLHLDMSYVNLSKASNWLQVTDTLPSLFELRLSYSQLPFIPPTPTINFSSLVVDLHNMTSLRHLDLFGNNFNSSIPNWLYSFSCLEFLNLGSSNL
ncbi:hypothetical protein RGQ29_015247 [Quercus rubra]|uniref:Leucine-rich repeat-containing N-terminal plant-type domain-containing protein n=1 Tax=Quercus rubra TaxID=3512 RepID=A0AAN7J441_QUERU|nr:hypothetical protein RGQ29_015247 [Quercus rubra]